ncbi:hypothetical protein IW261DRAFT_1560077 [Armillaria novae-zelandiae]|uniref:Uncharacterized protein n=1 Tax=Armillaria novae-zelandiae TaxID=153914 RepID=A0AA39PHQ2_9AGAR|nr:hypothetical protein IW261DRAFT_1560077 [Armillaria novae-zelandiae]
MFSLVLSTSRPRCFNAPRSIGSSIRQLAYTPKNVAGPNHHWRPPAERAREKEKYLARWDAQMKAEQTWNMIIIRGTDPSYDTLVDLLKSLPTYNPFMFHPSSRIRDSKQTPRNHLPNFLSPRIFVPPIERVCPTRDDVDLISHITGRPWLDLWNKRHRAAPTHSLDEFLRHTEQYPEAVMYPILIVRDETVFMGVRRILRAIKEWKQEADKRERHEIDRLATHETSLAEKEVELRRKLYGEVYGPGTTFYEEIGEKVVAREKRLARERVKNAGLFRAAIIRHRMRTQ